MRGVLLAAALALAGCPEHHLVVPADAAAPDAPAPLELCITTSVRCMLPVSDPSCPDRAPTVGGTCPEDGVECAYCPGGDYGVSGAQTRTCIGRRWSGSRVSCGGAP